MLTHQSLLTKWTYYSLITHKERKSYRNFLVDFSPRISIRYKIQTSFHVSSLTIKVTQLLIFQEGSLYKKTYPIIKYGLIGISLMDSLLRISLWAKDSALVTYLSNHCKGHENCCYKKKVHYPITNRKMSPLQMLILQTDQLQLHILLPIAKTVQSLLTNPPLVVSVSFSHQICWMTLFLGIHKHLFSLERKQSVTIKVHLGELMSFVGVTSRNISEELQRKNCLEGSCITKHPFLNECKNLEIWNGVHNLQAAQQGGNCFRSTDNLSFFQVA